MVLCCLFLEVAFYGLGNSLYYCGKVVDLHFTIEIEEKNNKLLMTINQRYFYFRKSENN